MSIKYPASGPIPKYALATSLADLVTIETDGLTKISITGTNVGSAALTDLQVSLLSTHKGTAVPVLSGTGGDFSAVSDFLTSTTASPHTTVAGGKFRFELTLDGKSAAIVIGAAGSAGAALQIEMCGM